MTQNLYNGKWETKKPLAGKVVGVNIYDQNYDVYCMTLVANQ